MDTYRDIVRYYDLEHDDFGDDLEFYLNVVREGPLLEVGCGSGRVLNGLAGTGLELHGLDPSAPMLEAAARRLERYNNVALHLGRVQDLDVPLTFKTVLLPLNVLWHLDEIGQQFAALSAIRAHMVRDGLLVIDLSNPLNMADRQSGNVTRLRFEASYEGNIIQCFSAAEEVAEEQLLRISIWYDACAPDGHVRRTVSEMPLRYTYRYELALMLEAAGFLVSRVYGSYDLDGYTAESESLLVVAASA